MEVATSTDYALREQLSSQAEGGLCTYCQVWKEANHTHAVGMYDIATLAPNLLARVTI